MNIDIASYIYEILKKEQYERDPDYKELRNQLIEHAVNYARIRVDWKLMDVEERKKMDDLRASTHTVFINSCNILSRYMKNNGMDSSWREKLTEDRKVIGDFACYLHCILGLRAR